MQNVCNNLCFYSDIEEKNLMIFVPIYILVFLQKSLWQSNLNYNHNIKNVLKQTFCFIHNFCSFFNKYVHYSFQFRNFKIVYRRYAGLYFCICVDVNDNNLCYLEAIHNFVEVLNEYFHNVCELDLVFNFYKVYTVVDEMFLAGEIRETSQTKVLKQLLMLNSLE